VGISYREKAPWLERPRAGIVDSDSRGALDLQDATLGQEQIAASQIVAVVLERNAHRTRQLARAIAKLQARRNVRAALEHVLESSHGLEGSDQHGVRLTQLTGDDIEGTVYSVQ
jgi:hypothetical protein